MDGYGVETLRHQCDWGRRVRTPLSGKAQGMKRTGVTLSGRMLRRSGNGKKVVECLKSAFLKG